MVERGTAAKRAGYGAAMAELELRRVEVNGVDFAYLTSGEGPLALCLHGFPDSANTWRHLGPRLVDAGYRVVAPFLRGYAPTAVPADGRYQIAMLALDAVGFHNALDGDGEAVIIGHDWGATTAYTAAVHAPERWRKVVGLAVPPGPALGVALTTNLAQVKRSWYMFFFQHPLADLVVPMDDLGFVDGLWETWSPGYTDSSDDRRWVKESLGSPENLAAALGYYRATLQPDLQVPELAAEEAAVASTPPQPHLYLHGVDDGCMGVELAERAEAYLTVEGSRVELVPGTGHFLHLEAPEVVNRHIVEFLTETEPSAGS